MPCSGILRTADEYEPNLSVVRTLGALPARLMALRIHRRGKIVVVGTVAFLAIGFTVPIIPAGESSSCGLPLTAIDYRSNACGCNWHDSLFLWLFGVGLRSTYETCSHTTKRITLEIKISVARAREEDKELDIEMTSRQT